VGSHTTSEAFQPANSLVARGEIREQTPAVISIIIFGFEHNSANMKTLQRELLIMPKQR
jgi:hypothetical protein